MSFPRANIKRFNEDSGCAPPPGTYNPKAKDKLQGVVLDTTDRFKDPKGPLNESSTSKTPIKQLFAVPQPNCKKATKSTSADASKIKELEQEVRKICKEKTEKEKVLSLKEDEIKKLDGKLHSAVSEKSSLQAKVASLEKDFKELRKSNEILKSKVSSSKMATKKQEDIQYELTTVKQQLTTKEQEINSLTIELRQIWMFLTEHLEKFESVTVSIEKAIDTYKSTVTELNKSDVDEIRQSNNSHARKSDTDISSLRDSSLKTEAKMKLCKRKSEELKTRFDKTITEFGTLSNLVKTKYSSIVTEHETLVKDLQQTKDELETAIANKVSLEQQRDSLQNEKCDLQKELSDRFQEAEGKYGSMMNQIDELLKAKEDTRAELVDLQKAYDISQAEFTSKLKQYEDREVLIGDTTRNLHERIVELQAENEDLTATLKETGELLSKTRQYNIELEKLLRSTEHRQETDKKQFLVQIEELVFKNSKTESQLCDAEERIKEIQVNLNNQKSDSEHQIETLTSQLDAKTADLLQLQDKLGNLVYEKSQLHSEIGHLEAQMKLIKSTSEQTKVEAERAMEVVPELMAKLEEVNADKSELDIEVAKLQCQIKVLEMEAGQVKQEYETALKDKEVELEKVKEEKLQMEHDMEQYGIDLLSNAAQLQTIQSKLDSKDSDFEKLLEDTDSLEEELQLQREINEDLQSQIEQLRADFIKRCEERDELGKKNEAKDKSLAVLATQVSALTTQIESLNVTVTQKTNKCEQLTQKLSETEDKLTLSSKQTSNYKQQIEDYLDHLQMKCDECEDLQQRCEDLDSELTASAKEIVDLTERVEAATRESEEKSKESACVSHEVEEELARYRSLYEELQAKVEPFLEQINAFELEKQALLGLNKNTQAEMDKLSANYAHLLGHQNQKQKIKHIMKLKEDIAALKNETMQLRAQVAKQKQTIKKLEEKSAPRRFDTSKKFSNSKENLTQSDRPKTPLKDANRK